MAGPFPENVERPPKGSFCGADDEIRTRDLNLGKVALYQLSYVRKATTLPASVHTTASWNRPCTACQRIV